MARPVQGDVFTAGELRPLTFVQGFNCADLVNTGKLSNLTTSNNYTYNNTQITVNDNGTGTITITANLSEAGEYIAQFRGEPSNNSAIYYSPIYSFRVQSPI